MSLAWQDEPFGTGMQRVALGLVDEGLDRLGRGPGSKAAKHVHETRKRCKELRAVARLVRPALGEDAYRRTNEHFRDASRHLSPIRDAQALLESFDDLLAADAGAVSVPVDEVRRELRRRAMAAASSVHEGDERIAAAVELLRAGRAEIEAWDVPDDAPADREVALAGIGKIHRQGRDGFAASRDGGDVHVFHDWRKRVKYLWYHLQVLDRLAPSMLGPFAASCKVLSDTIGDGHDLFVLEETLVAEPDRFGGGAQVTAVVRAAEARRTDLERRAVGFGARVYGETTRAFVGRLDAYWLVTAELGPEEAAGGIDAVGGVADHLDERRASDLRAVAQEAGVRGRWRMRKAELVPAVRAALAGTRRPAGGSRA